MSAHSEWLDQFEERNALEVTPVWEAIPYPAVPSLMTEPARRFPTPWHADGAGAKPVQGFLVGLDL
jgi:hypothetical protein